MGSAYVKMLDIVCNSTLEIPILHRLAILIGVDLSAASVETCADGKTIEDAVVGRFSDDVTQVIIAVPDVQAQTRAKITIMHGDTLEVDTGPVEEFDIMVMPSSHLCFGYNTGLPEHIEAGRVVRSAVDMLEANPSYRWNIEFVRGAKKLLSKYPELAEQARKQYEESRLGIGATWTSSFYENFDAEAEVRQLVEAQWWLRDNFGAISRVNMGHDSAGYDPQQPQILRQAGIDFYWRCRYTLVDKSFGSPFLDHVGVDGTSIPCFTSRKPIGSGYNWAPFPEISWDQVVDRSSSTAFAVLANSLGEYVRNCREICGADFNAHFTASDQCHADHSQPERIAAWNKVFRTPGVKFASIQEGADRLINSREFKRTDQEPEQPHWSVVTVAGYRLTLPFQEASHMLCTAEKAAAIDLEANGAPYPADELQAAWMHILDEQHHEQLGYGAHDQVEHARDGILRSIATAQSITRSAALRTASKIAFKRCEPAVTVFNYLNWQRRDIVETQSFGGDVVVRNASGDIVPHEVSETGKLRFMASTDGMGYSTYYVEKSNIPSPPAGDLSASETSIENTFYRLEIDPKTGCILRLFDKELQEVIAEDNGDRLPFELVINEDSGIGYCAFMPTGRLWRASDLPGASVKAEATGLAARLTVERPLLADSGEARVGSRLRIEYQLPTHTKRLDVKIFVDWDSEPKRELRLFVPLALKSPKISYDTLFSTSDYDPDLAKRQRLNLVALENYEIRETEPFDYRFVTRFVSAYDASSDIAATLSAPHSLMRVEHGGISFTLIEDRTDYYWDGQLADMKGSHTFHTSITSHRGDWKAAKDWRFGWEHRGHFNNMVAVTPDSLYPTLPESGRLVEIDGENLVLTALKNSHEGEDMIVRVYDASGDGDNLGFRLATPYAGVVPCVWGWEQSSARQRGAGVGTDVAGTGTSASDTGHRALIPLMATGAWETNLLEDPQREIDLNQLSQTGVSVRPHGILTARVRFEVLDHSWKAVFV